jgi:hypothetical protein
MRLVVKLLINVSGSSLNYSYKDLSIDLEDQIT